MPVCPHCGQPMWHLCKGFEHKGFGKGMVKGKGKHPKGEGNRMQPSKRWKGALVPKGKGKGEGKGKGKSYLQWAWARHLEAEAAVAIERLRLEAERRAWARARAKWLRSLNPWRWILMD